WRREKLRSENVKSATTSAKERKTNLVPSSMDLMAGKRARSRGTITATPTRTLELYGAKEASGKTWKTRKKRCQGRRESYPSRTRRSLRTCGPISSNLEPTAKRRVNDRRKSLRYSLKMEINHGNKQTLHPNRRRHHRTRGTADMRRRGTIAENRLFG